MRPVPASHPCWLGGFERHIISLSWPCLLFGLISSFEEKNMIFSNRIKQLWQEMEGLAQAPLHPSTHSQARKTAPAENLQVWVKDLPRFCKYMKTVAWRGKGCENCKMVVQVFEKRCQIKVRHNDFCGH